MKLRHPFIITPRLMAGVKIGEGFISIGYLGSDGNGRTGYDVWFDLPDGTEVNDQTLKSGVGGGTLQDGMSTLLAFLGACAEGRKYQTRTGRESECADLFPGDVGEWAEGHSDEIDMLQLEIEEAEATLVIES